MKCVAYPPCPSEATHRAWLFASWSEDAGQAFCNAHADICRATGWARVEAVSGVSTLWHRKVIRDIKIVVVRNGVSEAVVQFNPGDEIEIVEILDPC